VAVAGSGVLLAVAGLAVVVATGVSLAGAGGIDDVADGAGTPVAVRVAAACVGCATGGRTTVVRCGRAPRVGVDVGRVGAAVADGATVAAGGCAVPVAVPGGAVAVVVGGMLVGVAVSGVKSCATIVFGVAWPALGVADGARVAGDGVAPVCFLVGSLSGGWVRWRPTAVDTAGTLPVVAGLGVAFTVWATMVGCVSVCGVGLGCAGAGPAAVGVSFGTMGGFWESPPFMIGVVPCTRLGDGTAVGTGVAVTSRWVTLVVDGRGTRWSSAL
jgi:hypothetical protein